jgi:hypothetical protein
MGARNRPRTSRISWSRRRALWTLALAPLFLAGGGFAWLASSTDKALLRSSGLAYREKRPILSPMNFTGKARRAHEVARDIPDVLDQLRCYCRCDGIGHVSLLSCYTDGHAAT